MLQLYPVYGKLLNPRKFFSLHPGSGLEGLKQNTAKIKCEKKHLLSSNLEKKAKY